MRALILLVVCGIAGCTLGAGGAVGYGTKRGFYAGGSVSAGPTVAKATIEVGGTRRGVMSQYRLDAEANRTQFTAWHVVPDEWYPGGRVGLGYAKTEGKGSPAIVIGPDVAVRFNTKYCEGAPGLYLGVEYRYVAGESQVVFAPRFDRLSDYCPD